MPPKLGHRKPRTGCFRCKVRKVKCDENDPCSNCVKHNVGCEFGDRPVRTTPQILPSREPNLTPTDGAQQPVPPLPRSPYEDLEDIQHAFTVEERRVLELRLIHHFTSIATYTFPGCHEQRYRDIWNIDAVDLALDHPFLLNAMLAMSSQHLVSDVPRKSYIYAHDTNKLSVMRILEKETKANRDGIYGRGHRIYLNLAIRQQREIVPHLSRANADAIFLASVLLSWQALNLLTPTPELVPYLPPIQWLSISKAISTIVETTKMMDLVQSKSITTMMIQMGGEPDFRNRIGLFNPLLRTPFAALLDWNAYPEPGIDEEMINTYEQTLAYVGGCYKSLLDNEPPRVLIRRLVCLGVMVPAQYMTLLAEGRPRALAILAHHFAVSQAVDDHWWFHGAAEREVLGVQSVLPPEWQWAMEWPLSMLKIGQAKWLNAGRLGE